MIRRTNSFDEHISIVGLATTRPIRLDGTNDSHPLSHSPSPSIGGGAPCRPGNIGVIIAIDGPAASGKGTLGRLIAAHYGLPHLDTGLLYRAVALSLLDAGERPDDIAAATAAAQALVPDFADARLRDRQLGEAASIVAAMPGVRAALVDMQRRFACQPEGAVLDGRDIGTVICPEADAKLFVTATPEERARRRVAELRARGENVDLDAMLDDIRKRDERDGSRTIAPLRRAPDARLLDTTELDIEAAFRAALRIIESV